MEGHGNDTGEGHPFFYPGSPASKGIREQRMRQADASFFSAFRVSAGSTTRSMSRSRIFFFSSKFLPLFHRVRATRGQLCLTGGKATSQLPTSSVSSSNEYLLRSAVYDSYGFSAPTPATQRVSLLNVSLRFLRSAHCNNVGLISLRDWWALPRSPDAHALALP